MFVSDNKIRSIYTYYQDKLKDLYTLSEIKHLANLSIESITGLSRTELLLSQEKPLSESELLRFRSIVKDLQEMRPIEYIIGEAEFCGLRLKVNENVLIPRPETEEIVENIRKDINEPVRIIDIGTGSGCIPITLKDYFPECIVKAMDVSADAIEIARCNADLVGVEVDFIEDSILSPTSEFDDPFDIIISNPPYVLESDKLEMQDNVLKYEPHLALFVADEDPLLFYHAIVKFSRKNLKNQGKLYFEIHENYAIQIKQLLLKSGYDSVEIIQDFYGKDRMIKAVK